MTDSLDERRAEGIVNALTERDETTCSECGGTIDLFGATDPMSVVAELEAHRQICTGREDDAENREMWTDGGRDRDLGTSWYVVRGPKQDPATVVAGPFDNAEAADRRASCESGARAVVRNGVMLVHDITAHDYRVEWAEEAERPDALVETDGGMLIAGVTYSCRVCDSTRKIYVPAVMRDGRPTVDLDSRHRLCVHECADCETDRTHVALQTLSERTQERLLGDETEIRTDGGTASAHPYAPTHLGETTVCGGSSISKPSRSPYLTVPAPALAHLGDPNRVSVVRDDDSDYLVLVAGDGEGIADYSVRDRGTNSTASLAAVACRALGVDGGERVRFHPDGARVRLDVLQPRTDGGTDGGTDDSPFQFAPCRSSTCNGRPTLHARVDDPELSGYRCTQCLTRFEELQETLLLGGDSA